jgi:tetratricopeptide (TPR) repeat protein
LRFWKGEGELSRVAAEEAVGLLEGVAHMEALAELTNAYAHLALEQGQPQMAEKFRFVLDQLIGDEAIRLQPDIWTAQVLRVGTYCLLLRHYGPVDRLTALAERYKAVTNAQLAGAAAAFLVHIAGKDSRWSLAAQLAKEAMEKFRSAGNLKEVFVNQSNASCALQDCAQLMEAISLAEDLYAQTTKHGATFAADFASYLACRGHLELGHLSQTKKWANIALERTIEHGNARLEAYVRTILARAAVMEGELDAASVQVERALKLTKTDSQDYSTVLATKAVVYLKKGDVVGALEYSKQAQSCLSEIVNPELSLEGLFVWLTSALVHLTDSDRGGAWKAIEAGRKWREASESTASTPRPYLYVQWDELAHLLR